MMVGPTNFMPRFFSSLEIFSARGEEGCGLRERLTTGRPSTCAQSHAAKDPCSACIRRKTRALGATDSSLPR